MPPSKERASQPVYAVAKALHEITGVYGTSRILRSTGGESLKNIHNRDAKIEALKGRFSVHDTITDGKWNAILIDDLFDSGASMEAACATLKTFRKVNNVYAATLTWK